MLAPRQHLERLGVRRRTHLGRKDEAVELRLRQRVRAVELGGVLRGHDKERLVQAARRPFDGDLALAHRLEQRRLGAGRRAIHLVGEDDVGEDRSGDELEGQVLLVEDARARDIGGQQVGRALDAAEGAADHDAVDVLLHASEQVGRTAGLKGGLF